MTFARWATALVLGAATFLVTVRVVLHLWHGVWFRKDDAATQSRWARDPYTTVAVFTTTVVIAAFAFAFQGTRSKAAHEVAQRGQLVAAAARPAYAHTFTREAVAYPANFGPIEQPATERLLPLPSVALEDLGADDRVWSFCVGIPVSAFRVGAGVEGWAKWGEPHNHSGEIKKRTVTDRDPGLYQTYVVEYTTAELKDRRGALPPLCLMPLAPGEHQIGLGMAPGKPGSDTTAYRASASVIKVTVGEATEQ